MMGDRSRQGKREVRPDVHERFLAIKARAEAEIEGIRQTVRTMEENLPKRGGHRSPKGQYQQFFIEEPEAVPAAPVELGFYVDEVAAG